jgi:hypothetical protein
MLFLLSPLDARESGMARRAAVSVILVLTTLSGSAFPPPPKETKPDPDKLAKELGDAFAQNLGNQNVDAILKTVEFPYRTVNGKDTKSADSVKEEIRDVLTAYWTDETTVAVKDVVAPDKFEAWAGGLPMKPEASKTEAARKSVLDHVGPGGRIVVLQFTIGGKKDDDLCLLLIRVKDGKAVLVGLVD